MVRNADAARKAADSAKESTSSVLEKLGLDRMLNWEHILAAVIALIVCVIAIRIIMRILRRIVERSKLSGSLGNFLLKLAKIALDFVAILIVAGSLGFDVTALLAVFSLLGLALSLSVQSSLTNLMSGIVILLTKPFAESDFVETDGVAGSVKNIGLFYTELTTLDNKTIFVPNSDLSASKIINYTREPNRRVDLKFGASYDYPVKTVLEALRGMTREIPGVLEDPEPVVLVENYASSNIEYIVRAWCRHEDYWDVYYAIQEAVPAAFEKAGVKMSYERVNVHMM